LKRSSPGIVTAAALLPLLCACNGQVSPAFAPAPRQMTPAGGSQTSSFKASVEGDFFLTATERAAQGGVSVDFGFSAFLDGTRLSPATWISAHQLDVTVPAGLPIGPHALTVVAPSGLSGQLPAAWTTTSALPGVHPVPLPPFPGSLPTTFAYVFGYGNQLWLGPAGDGGGAISIAAPDGTSPAKVGFQLRVDNASAFYQARNLAWVTSAPPTPMPPATTVGYSGCAQGTKACGPDGENGRGIFFSAVINNTELMGLTGARDTLGARFLYLTTGSFPAPAPGKLDFAYENLRNGVNDTTLVATAAYAFNDILWMGYSDNGNPGAAVAGPVLHQLINLVPALPGANASAAELLNLRADYMPYVGANGGSSPNLSAPPLMIDSFTSFGTTKGQEIYLANNGGWLRSTNGGAPRACTGKGTCADWVAISPNAPGATPAAAANYAAECSLTTAKGSELEPADKAVPFVVPFGGRLFLARNTYTATPSCSGPTSVLGPQLWSCSPSGPSQQCNPGDWALVAPNAAGDVHLTQMQDANNTAIALLAAADGYLYVGFNNAAGVQIYRTAKPAAATQADFTGQNGCTAGVGGCAGISGNGLGQGMTRIFDGRAISLPGSTRIYLTAGTGTSPVSLFRIDP
jgi:hypothetical protein